MNNDLNNILRKYQGDGAYLYVDGIKYIDAASGTFNLPLGYTNRNIADRLKHQIDRTCHLSSSYTLEMSQIILQALRKHLPCDLSRIWLRDVSGSGAMECAIRMAQKYTRRSGVMSVYLAHHGQSLATAQISGNAFRLRDFDIVIPGSMKIPAPRSVFLDDEGNFEPEPYVDLDRILELATSDNIACLVLEPILGNGGNIVLPQGFYAHVREFCSRNKIVLIADEVQTGFGRTGTFFASTGYAKMLDPDIIVFAKGATGIGLPVGGVIMRPELDVLEFYEHSSTCGANPLCLVAIDETIKIIEDDFLLDRVKRNETLIKNSLLRLQHKYDCVSGVRGLGYMFGFDMPSIANASELIKTAYKTGLIVRGARYGHSPAIKIRPPIICREKEILEIFDKLDKSLSGFENKQ